MAKDLTFQFHIALNDQGAMVKLCNRITHTVDFPMARIFPAWL
jgi:hypothetical protein